MKFTKEEAFEKLKAILTNDGKKPLRMSEQSINKQLETLMPLIASDETELNDFVEKVKPTFETMNGNAEKDRSDFIEDWKKKHPEQQQQQQQQQQTKSDNPEVQALMDRVAELEKDKKENATKAAIAVKKSELITKLKEKGINDKDWCDAMVNEISLDENTDVDAKATSLLNLYNKNKSTYTPKTPGSPTAGEQKDEFDDIRDARKQELGIQDGQ